MAPFATRATGKNAIGSSLIQRNPGALASPRLGVEE